MTTKYVTSGSIYTLSKGRHYCSPDVSGMPISGAYTYLDVVSLTAGEYIFFAYPVRTGERYIAFYVNGSLSEWM